MHHGVRTLAAQIAVVSDVSGLVGKTLYFNNIALHALELLNGVIQFRLLVLLQSALADTKINGGRADQLVVVQVLDGRVQLGPGLLSKSVRCLSLLRSCCGGGIGLGCGCGSFGGLFTSIGGFLIGGSYLPVQITNGLVSLGLIVVSLLLQSADLSLRLVDLILDRGNGFPDVLLRGASYTGQREYSQSSDESRCVAK